MSLGLEFKKLRRTGYVPTFFAGAVLAAAVPIVNMAVRSDIYVSLPGHPLTILADANWQMIAMLNILLAVCGACIMYHTEYADNGAQKMDVLPVRPGSLFLGKFIVAALFLAIPVLIETAALAGCALHWFPGYELSLTELAKYAGFSLAMMLPTIVLMLIVASAFRNMWVSLGIGVILVFLLLILPQDNLILNLCPFRSPYQILAAVQEEEHTALFLSVCGAETVLLGAAQLILLKVRRCFA